MNLNSSDLLVIGAIVLGGVVILNAADNAVTTASNDIGTTVATVAPWTIAGIIAWGIFLA